MKRLTQNQVREAAKKSKRVALDMSIYKYRYLMQLTQEQLMKLPSNFIKSDYCALCGRYAGKVCPLKGDRCPKFGATCTSEWSNMCIAFNRFQKHGIQTDYNMFMSNAAQTYIKLLKLRGVI